MQSETRNVFGLGLLDSYCLCLVQGNMLLGSPAIDHTATFRTRSPQKLCANKKDGTVNMEYS